MQFYGWHRRKTPTVVNYTGLLLFCWQRLQTDSQVKDFSLCVSSHAPQLSLPSPGTQKMLNFQRCHEQKEQCWNYHSTLSQIILQSYRNENSMAQRQIHRTMQDRWFSNKFTQWPLLTKMLKKNAEEKNSLFNKGYWRSWVSMCRRMKLNPYFLPCIKVHLK